MNRRQFKIFISPLRKENGQKQKLYAKLHPEKCRKRMAEAHNTEGCRDTRLALLWMNLAAEPLVSLYTLIPFYSAQRFWRDDVPGVPVHHITTSPFRFLVLLERIS